MSTGITVHARGALTPERIRATKPQRRLLLPRIVAGVPLLGTGLSHILVPEAPLQPLVEAAGFPFAAVVSPIAIAVKIAAGVLLLLGLWARVGAAVGVFMMIGALYAHMVIDVWPNAPEVSEPPLVLPISVLVASAYVLWRGAGRWSFDRRARRPAART
jgi:putative oxidoreductase